MTDAGSPVRVDVGWADALEREVHVEACDHRGDGDCVVLSRLKPLLPGREGILRTICRSGFSRDHRPRAASPGPVKGSDEYPYNRAKTKKPRMIGVLRSAAGQEPRG